MSIIATQEELGAAKTRQMFGRSVIYSSAKEITKENVIQVLNTALIIHNQNSSEIAYLENYYKGNQPILSRVKDVRSEINNKIVENHAYEIVEFKKGYVFGEPIQLVGIGEDKSITDNIELISKFLMSENKQTRDIELAEWFNICGTSYRMTLPNTYGDSNDIKNHPFEIDTLDPKYAFVVYSNGFKKRPLMSVKYVVNEFSLLQTPLNLIYSVYTDTMYYEIENNQIINGNGDGEPHILGTNPIIEYPANYARLGSFEVVLSLLDAINNVSSNRLDGVEQFIQAFMVFTNCDISDEKFDELKERGALKLKSDNGNVSKVDLLTSELDQQQTQTLIDNLYQMVLIVCGMPDRNGANRTTGDTGAAVILRDGWSAAESRARDTESIFKPSERKFLQLIINILKNQDINIDIDDIDIKFSRNKVDNLVTKVQGLRGMLEAGINPKIAINVCNLFSDPEQVFRDSLETLKKWEIEYLLNSGKNTDPNTLPPVENIPA